MTHVMVPDGVLPWWLSAAGWVLAVALLAFAMWRLRGVPAARTVPLVGIMTALMVVIMSFELVPIGYELHFTVLTGIVIGPWYGAISAFIFNVLRALLGDGAFTNIGLNTVVTWIEIALGAAVFAAFRPLVRRWGPGPAAGAATFVALLVATFVFIGIIGLSTIDPSQAIHTGAYDVEAGGFKDSPLAEGIVSVRVTEEQEAREAAERAGLGRFAVALLVLGLIGWTVEAVLVGAVAAFIARVRPGLLGLGPAAAAESRV
jgi:cobalt/nickel transport system permease protein